MPTVQLNQVKSLEQEQADKPRFAQVKNQTARRIGLTAKKIAAEQRNPLLIPAFGSVEIKIEMLKDFEIEEWERSRLVQVDYELTPREKSQKFWEDFFIVFSQFMLSLLTFGAILLILLGFLQIFFSSPSEQAFWIGLLAFTIILLLLFFVAWLILLNRSKDFAYKFHYAIRGLIHFFYLLLIILISLGLPCAAIYYVNGGPNLWNASPTALVGRGLQVVFIGVASLVPGLMYFLYARQHLDFLKESFFQEVMLLDPNIITKEDAIAKYERNVDEVFGSRKLGRLGYSRNFPVVLSTLLIMIGWLVVLNVLEKVKDSNIQDLLNPKLTNLFAYGFLGAYFFSVSLVFRRYLRADLTAQAYSHITVRILISTVLVWVVQLGNFDLSTNPFFPALAFFIGVIPETALTFLQKTLKKTFTWLPSIEEGHPLNKLDGINLYDQARLLEEGIENIENLAHHNLIELRLRTRIPMARIVDLFDQAILYLHLGDEQNQLKKDRQKLREYGIRTATDLLLAEGSTAGRPGATEELLALLVPSEAGPAPQPAEAGLINPPPRVPRLRIIIDTLRDDEWLAYLQNWRKLTSYTETIYSPQQLYPK